MLIKFKVQICKAIYSGLLFVLIFAVFSANNVPAARAQETTEETPTVTPEPPEITTATTQTETLSPTENITVTPQSTTLSPSETATASPITITDLPSETPTPVSNEYIDYTVPYLGLKFTYPNSWTIQPLPDLDYGFRISSPEIVLDPTGNPLSGAYISADIWPETETDWLDFSSNPDGESIVISGYEGILVSDATSNTLEWHIYAFGIHHAIWMKYGENSDDYISTGRQIVENLVFTGIYEPDPRITPREEISALATLNHSGTISSDETWSSGDNVHVIDSDVTVASGVTLTISEGAIVKFKSNTSLFVQGALRILGTSSNPIYITSIKDDTIGGDTNGDGASSSPARGDWDRIEFQNSSDDVNSLIDYAIIRYGGGYSGGNYHGGISLLSASPTIQNTTFASNQYYAIRADVNSLPTLTNNTYTNNGVNGLAIQGGTIASNTTWDMTDTAYYIIDDVAVAVGSTLTVSPGVVVKFNDDRNLLIQGALRVLGTSEEKVYFTSNHDDTVQGDTNNDGASSPARGDWDRIEFQNSSDDVNSLVDYAIIRYGGGYSGGNYHGGISLLSASPTIQNTTFASNQYYAIRADVNSLPTLTNNTYTNNGVNGLAIQGGTIASNTTWDMTDTAYYIIDDVAVAVGSTLTVSPGVVVKFNDDRNLLIQGALRVLGTSEEKVYFTSNHDDTVQGDTNNDGASSPARGDWDRIEFQNSSDDVNSLVDYAIIRYGGGYSGGNYHGGISLLSASPTIQNTTFASNQYYAIRADVNSLPILTNNTYTNNGINGLAVQGGTITSDTTWNMTDTSYYIIDDVAVGVGSTLTISPGVVVKFNDYRALLVQGALRVLGTPDAMVYFTSQSDDTVKGDTNNNGAGDSPVAGDWERIEFQDSSDDASSLIDYAVIHYGGKYNNSGSEYGGVTLISASPTIQNTTFASNQYYAIRANVSSLPTLTNNTYTNNGINGLVILGGTITSNTTWDMTDTAYYILDDVAVAVGSTLTVSPGVVVKFNDDRALLVQGALRVLGTSGDKVYFTSERDDTVKGDTNNNGSSNSPAAGDWERIEFQDSSDDASSLIDYAIIRYAGGYNYSGDEYGGLTLLSASPTIQNTTISQNQYYGIYTNNSTPTLNCNNIRSNNSHGLYNATTGVTVNAENQWWGSTSGPYHPTLNPSGTGNKVTNGVDFIPFRTSPCGIPEAPGAFIKTSPTNGSSDQALSLTLTWDTSNKSTSYEYCYDTSNDNACSSWINTDTETSASISGLSFDTTYYWHVRAWNGTTGPTYANGSATAFWKFTTQKLIISTAPTGIDASDGTYPDQVQVTWDPVFGATSYKVYRASTPTGTQKILGSVASPPYTDVPSAGIIYYYWVQACNLNGCGPKSTYDSGWRFTTDVVAAPQLLLPINGAYLNITQPILTWDSVLNAATYEIQIDTNTKFTAPFTQTGMTDTDECEFQTNALSDRKYYWRVRGISSASQPGPWGSKKYFTIDTTPPAIPILYRPSNNATTYDTTPTLSVKAVNSAKSYRFQLANDFDFMDVLVNQTTTSKSSSVPIDQSLDYKSGYYWRAKAIDAAGNESDWSQPNFLTITFQKSPGDNTYTTDTTPSFSWYAVTGAMGYELEIFDDAETTAYSTTLGIVTRHTIPIVSKLDYGKYTWVMRVKLDGDWIETPVRNLTITPPLLKAPVLLSPSNGYQTLDTTPTLEWSVVGETAKYEIWLDNSTKFTSREYEKFVNGGLNSHELETSLPDGKYYWKIRSINYLDIPGAWSAKRPIIIDTVAPAIPRLYKPKNLIISRGTPAFTWRAVKTAKYYQFQITDISDPAFSTPTHESLPTLKGRKYRPPLLNPGDYLWRVRVRDAAGNWSDWCSARTITIIPTIPTAPVLITPINGFISSSPTPIFTWNSVAYGHLYQIQISTSSRFMTITQDRILEPGLTEYLADTLPTGTYYWRVRAINIDNESGKWSAKRKIIIIP